MTKNVASPKSTGGGGFLFEDKVCAWFVVHMLSDDLPLEPAFGPIVRLDFQTRPDGWFFDDILLTAGHGDDARRCAFSIKSNTQFGVATAPSEFVETAWEQYLREGSAVFDPARDLMGLITTPLDGELRASLDFVQSCASDLTSDLLPGRNAEEEWASKARRNLFESFRCPSALANKKGVTNADIGRLLSRLRFMQFDFESKVSDSEKLAIELCRKALRSGEHEDARAMWATILAVTAGRRTTAGSIGRRDLMEQLAGRFRLLELPNCRDDWHRLQLLAASNMGQLRDVIGEQIQLVPAKVLAALPDALESHSGAIVLGPSGVGKSGAAKAFATALAADGEHVLWFNAASFDKTDFAAFQAPLQLAHPIQDLLHSVASKSGLMVLDGLDRLYSPTAFRIVATLIHAAIPDNRAALWRIIVTCQTQEWSRLRDNLLSAGVRVRDWPCLEVETWLPDDLAPVWDAIPGTARLKLQKKLQPLWGNLKILDLLATGIGGGADVETSGWVGETNVATWYWQSYVRSGFDRHVQERFAIGLAEKEANELRSTFALDLFSESELGPFEALRQSGVCQSTPDGRIKFSHDLFGDWARLHVLISHADDFLHFVETRISSPLWHRAIRLYGVYLLENQKNVKEWRSLLHSLTVSGNAGTADLLLEAVIFAANPGDLLSGLRTDLLDPGSDTLKRLLGRFLACATVADIRYEVDGEPLSPRLASRLRYPSWLDWPPLLKFLFENREAVVTIAPFEMAKIAALWFEHTPKAFPFRKEMASIGLMLGHRANSGWRDHTVNNAGRRLSYQVALAGADEYPEEVADFCRSAAARDSPEGVADRDDEPVEMFPPGMTLDPRYDPDTGASVPWPDGPQARVDDEFRYAVLDDRALIPLMRVSAAVSREIILAVMIKKRPRFDWYNSVHHSRELDLHSGDDWSTPLFTQGPFLTLLQIDFREGLETIARLVDFASERWSFYTTLSIKQYAQGQQAPAGDPLSALVEQALRPPGTTVITFDDGDRELLGDDRVYEWAAKNPPTAIGPALMALEKHIYNQLESGHAIGDLVQAVLERTCSVAMLKVLIEIGKRQPSLFKSVLRPLLTIPDIYFWELKQTAADRQVLMMFAFRKTHAFIESAREFHGLPHRAQDLTQLAIKLFLTDESSRDFLSQVRVRWQSRMQEGSGDKRLEYLQAMIEAFDSDSYGLAVDENGDKVLVNVRAHERYVAQSAERDSQRRKMEMLMLPARVRRYIDAGERFKPDELSAIWMFLEPYYGSWKASAAATDSGASHSQTGSALDATTDTVSVWLTRAWASISGFLRFLHRSMQRRRVHDDGRDEPAKNPSSLPQRDVESENDEADAVMAAIAALYRQREELLDAHQERLNWCMIRLEAAIEAPVQRRRLDQIESVVAWTWDCHAAQMIAQRWLENPADRRLRYLLARLILLAPHNNAVGIIFQRISEDRAAVRIDFARLRCLIFHLANMRARIRFVEQYATYEGVFSKEEVTSFRNSLDPWARRCVSAFIDGSLGGASVRWDEMDSEGSYVAVDAIRERYLPHYMLDMELVKTAHAWLPTLADAIDDDEREEWIGFWKSALDFAVKRVHLGRDDRRFPYDIERWILERVGGVVAEMRVTESPESLWRPVVDLPPDCHSWSETMLESFHRTGLSKNPVSGQFESTRTAIIEHLLAVAELPTTERWSTADDVWQAVIGLDFYTQSYWEIRHRPIVMHSASSLSRWVTEIGAATFSQLGALATWLQREAADPVRMGILIDICQTMKGEGLLALAPRGDSGDAVALLLHSVWDRDQALLRADDAALAAFKELLRWLVDRQNSIGLQLSRKVGSL
jgi:hypothetical protein